jgi:hypothetical protein
MKKITFLALLIATLSINAQVLSEDFSDGSEGSTFPNGWTTTMEDGSSGNWVLGNTANTGVPAYGGDTGMTNGGCEDLYALLDSDGIGSSGSQNASLISPVMDLSNYNDLILKFNHHFRVYNANADYGYVEATIDGGASWENITTFTGANNYVAEGLTSFDISTLAGNPAVQIRFRYVGTWGYYWGVDNVEVTECTTAAPISVSIPTLPLDSAVDVIINYGVDNIINFEWPAIEEDPEIESYTFNLSSAIEDFPNIGSLSISNNLVNLIYTWEPNTTYYWSIDASNCAGTTSGTIFSFTTGACSDTAPPEAVTSPGPADGATDVELDSDTSAVAFTWIENEEGLFYAIYFDTDPMFPNPLTANFVNGNTITGLAEDTTYYWKIETYNCFGNTPSETWSFTTGSSTAGLNDNEFNNVKMYPNPANDLLNFYTNSSENIDVQIFDILGKSVLRLENVLNSINISELKSGIYFVQISLGTEKTTKKLIVN